MQIFSGYSIVPAVIAGPLRFVRSTLPDFPVYSARTPDEELDRFTRAQRRSVLELARLYDDATALAGQKISTIFAIHAMLLEDRDYQDAAHASIRTLGFTAEHASKTAFDRLITTFETMDSAYMQARAADVRDISNRMIRALTGQCLADSLGPNPSILVAQEFFPSQIMTLDRSRLLGVVSRCGSVHSHAAALAQALDIPSLVGVEVDPSLEGHTAVLDGNTQRLYVDPTAEVLSRAQEPNIPIPIGACE